MHGVPARPLSPEEIELLQIELVEHMDAVGNMPLDVTHGFLTATAAEDEPLLDRVLGTLAQDAGLHGRDCVPRRPSAWPHARRRTGERAVSLAPAHGMRIIRGGRNA